MELSWDERLAATLIQYGPLLVVFLLALWLAVQLRTRSDLDPRLRTVLLVLFGMALVLLGVLLVSATQPTSAHLLRAGLIVGLALLLWGLVLWSSNYNKENDVPHVHLTNLSIALFSGASIAVMLFSMQIVIAQEAEKRAFDLLIGTTSDLRGFSVPDGEDGLLDMSEYSLRGKDLRRGDFDRASLDEADLSFTNLTGATFQCADLRGADLRSALLAGADLRGAILDNANLFDADLSNAMLQGASLKGARVGGTNMHATQQGVWTEGVERGVRTEDCPRWKHETEGMPTDGACTKEWLPWQVPTDPEHARTCGADARSAWVG